MKVKEKQRSGVAVSAKTRRATSSDEEDSDVEKNFALLTGKQRQAGADQYQREEEEDDGDFSEDQDDEVEEDDDEDASDVGEGESDDGKEEDDDSDASEEEDGEAEEEEAEDTSDVSEHESDDGDDDDSDVSEEEDGEDEDPEDAGASRSLQTREDLKKKLSNMSFEDIMKLQRKVGTKVYNEVAYGDIKKQVVSKKKRLNKNRPVEISAKRPAPFLRQVVPVKKPTLRDPRFDDLSGEYKPEIFEKTYKFITDMRLREKEVVKKQLRNMNKNNQRKEQLEFLLRRMENQERARLIREQQRERELALKRQQRERANQGARPFFLKKSEQKKMQLADKYQQLKKSGKLENFLSKKRKRNAGKDRRKLPQGGTGT